MYDPPLVTTLDEAIVLTCPRCGNGNLSVPWLTQPPASADGSRTNGTGYAQHGFLTTCGACAAKINRDTFLVDKLARDIAHVTEARDRGVTELFPFVLVCLSVLS